MSGFELRITPEPSPEDRATILAAVRDVLRREEELARPSAWRVAGWTNQRAGLIDFGASVPARRRWSLSARLPRGGPIFPGLNGRGDAK